MGENEMVERVARAIMEARGGCKVVDWSEAERNPHVAQALTEARAAIAAMRLPNGASSVSGGMAIEDSMFAAEDTVFHGAATCWNAIIDDVLA